jgi:hypothetical protein
MCIVDETGKYKTKQGEINTIQKTMDKETNLQRKIGCTLALASIPN